jgi:hypothetical protein
MLPGNTGFTIKPTGRLNSQKMKASLVVGTDGVQADGSQGTIAGQHHIVAPEWATARPKMIAGPRG